MSRIKYILLAYKNLILLLIFCLAVIIGYYTSLFFNNAFAENYYINEKLVGYIGLALNFLTIIPMMYFSIKFFNKLEENFIRKQAKEIEIRYPRFLESIKLMDNVYELNFFVFYYRHLYRFQHLDFLIQLKLTKINTFEIFWYKDEKQELVGSRTIYYKNEPTIQTVLENGPYYSIKLNFWYDSKSR